MTESELRQIKKRYAAAHYVMHYGLRRGTKDPIQAIESRKVGDSCNDVPALLREVRRLKKALRERP